MYANKMNAPSTRTPTANSASPFTTYSPKTHPVVGNTNKTTNGQAITRKSTLMMMMAVSVPVSQVTFSQIVQFAGKSYV